MIKEVKRPKSILGWARRGGHDLFLIICVLPFFFKLYLAFLPRHIIVTLQSRSSVAFVSQGYSRI